LPLWGQGDHLLLGEGRESKVERAPEKMKLAMDMLLLHLPLIPSARGQKVEAELVGIPHQGCSQLWAAMPKDEVASLPGTVGLPLGQSRSQTQRASPLRAKLFGLLAYQTGRAAADAVSGVLTTLVRHAITPSTQHVLLTDEVPRRLVPQGRVSQGYKSHTKGLGHASETGRASPQPRPKGCQQRQSRGLRARSSVLACSERQNLRVPGRPLRSMGSVSSATAASKWPGRTFSCQLADLLSNGLAQPEREGLAVRRR
jgi:hypothetical protein